MASIPSSAASVATAHLAVAFCPALNIPSPALHWLLGDVSAAALSSGRFCGLVSGFRRQALVWFDPEVPRIGKVLMARGRDAANIAMTTTFGPTRSRPSAYRQQVSKGSGKGVEGARLLKTFAPDFRSSVVPVTQPLFSVCVTFRGDFFAARQRVPGLVPFGDEPMELLETAAYRRSSHYHVYTHGCQNRETALRPGTDREPAQETRR